MKKHLILLSALLLMMPLALASCSSDDDNNSAALQPVTLTSPEHKDDAVKMNFTEETIVENKIIKSIELTESGKFLVTYSLAGAKTRSSETPLYLMGEYVKNGASITLSGFGTIEVNGEQGPSAAVTIKVGDSEVNVPATLTKNQAEQPMDIYLCRTWTVEKTRLLIGAASVQQDFNGCNIYEVVEFVKSKGMAISDKFSSQKVVRGVTFTSANTFLVNYADNSYDVGTWSWNGGVPTAELQAGDITYSWNGEDMGNSLMKSNSQASVAFTAAECRLTLKAQLQDKDVEVVWYMR